VQHNPFARLQSMTIAVKALDGGRECFIVFAKGGFNPAEKTGHQLRPIRERSS
jgi:hypothetical protein